MRKYKNRSYKRELLATLIPQCLSYAELIRHLGLKISGSNHCHVKNRVTQYGLDTSHFTGQGHNKGKISGQRKSWQEVLTINQGSHPRHSQLLLRALLEHGRAYQCELCPNNGIWNGLPLTLQIDHKNGNRKDDTPKNLRLLCPNCHSQTPNFNRSTIKRHRRPSKEALRHLLWQMSTKQIAECFGVSDKAVEKWSKLYQLSKPPRGYWAKRYAQKIPHTGTTQPPRPPQKIKRITRAYKRNILSIPSKKRNPNPDPNWRHAEKPHFRKVERPSQTELEELIRTLPWTKIGIKYGVCDNTIRKWAARYGIIKPTK